MIMKVGDTVVCIKTSMSSNTIKGEDYIIKNIINFNGEVILCFGIPWSYRSMFVNGKSIDTDTHLQLSYRFAPIQYNTAFKSNSVSKGLAKEALESVEIIEQEELELTK